VVENTLFFKSIDHAKRFRSESLERFERASLPGTSPERARELLSFCVVGAGPTGVELAAELHDLLEQDVARLFGSQLLELVSITSTFRETYVGTRTDTSSVIDLQDFILSSYDRSISEYATAFFKRQGIKLRLGQQVQEVRAGELVLVDKKTKELSTLQFGLCVWSTGIRLHPLAEGLIRALPEGTQPNIRSLTVDSSLRVKGARGHIFAIGDACTVELKPAAPHAARMLASCTAMGECSLEEECLSREALVALLKRESAEFPHLVEAADRVAADAGA